MKLRIGFVSNSSSEAFICNTTKTPEHIEEELRELLDVYNKMTGQERGFDSVFRGIWKAGKGDEAELREYLKYYKEKPPIFFNPAEEKYDDLNGKVIIYSADDNSIPYPLFEIISEAYQATRIHLG